MSDLLWCSVYVVLVIIVLLYVFNGVIRVNNKVFTILNEPIGSKHRRIGVAITTRVHYTTVKGSSGILDAYYRGLTFRVADELYEAREATLASIRREASPLPEEVRMSLLTDLYNEMC